MIYLTPEDLIADSQERFITESSADAPGVLDTIEKTVVALAISFLSGRYDTALVFALGAPVRNEMLVDIMAKIMLYKLFRRNAARKVSTDIKEDYEWAMRQLEKLQTGRITVNLPAPTDEGSFSNTIFGNNTNTDFYI